MTRISPRVPILCERLFFAGLFSLMLSFPQAFAQESPPDTRHQEIFNQAGKFLQQGDYKAAIKQYKKAIQEEPSSPYGYLGLGISLKAIGKLEESQEILEKLVDLYPQFAPGHYNLGMVLEAKGDFPQAKTHYRKFVELSQGQLPTDPEVRIKLRKMGLY